MWTWLIPNLGAQGLKTVVLFRRFPVVLASAAQNENLKMSSGGEGMKTPFPASTCMRLDDLLPFSS